MSERPAINGVPTEYERCCTCGDNHGPWSSLWLAEGHEPAIRARIEGGDR